MPDRSKPRPRSTRPDSGFVLLLAVVAMLSVAGMVMVLSASSVQSLRESGSTWTYFARHVTTVAIGGLGLWCAMRVDYRRWRRWSVPLLLLAIGLLLVVLVPGVGVRVNGSRSWLGAGPLRMQPAEVAKLALLLFVADLLARRAGRLDDSRATLRPALVVVAAVLGLVMLQPDLGTAMVIGSIFFATLFVGGIPLGRLTGVWVVATAGAMAMSLSQPYRRHRLLAFLDPSADPSNTGYQINQSLMGVASGGLLGVGLGESRAKWGFLPNAHTDFIFAIVAEELGLVGALAVVSLFVGFAVLGMRAALRAPDRFGTLLAAGITAWVLSQAFVNVGGVVGLLPITGLPLPFISFGGTSMVIVLVATGILLNIARQGGARPVPRSSAHPAVRAQAGSRPS